MALTVLHTNVLARFALHLLLSAFVLALSLYHCSVGNAFGLQSYLFGIKNKTFGAQLSYSMLKMERAS